MLFKELKAIAVYLSSNKYLLKIQKLYINTLKTKISTWIGEPHNFLTVLILSLIGVSVLLKTIPEWSLHKKKPSNKTPF